MYCTVSCFSLGEILSCHDTGSMMSYSSMMSQRCAADSVVYDTVCREVSKIRSTIKYLQFVSNNRTGTDLSSQISPMILEYYFATPSRNHSTLNSEWKARWMIQLLATSQKLCILYSVNFTTWSWNVIFEFNVDICTTVQYTCIILRKVHEQTGNL